MLATHSVAERIEGKEMRAVETWSGSGMSLTQASVTMPNVPSDPQRIPSQSKPGSWPVRFPNSTISPLGSTVVRPRMCWTVTPYFRV